MKKKLPKKILRNWLLITFLLSALLPSQAQIGSIDPTFDPDDGANFIINTTAILPDGKILIGGAFSDYNMVSRNGIARLNADGTLDTTFDPGTGIPVISTNSGIAVESILVQSDGKIIIAGTFSSYNGTPVNNIARLNTDGTLDTTFTLDSRISSVIYTMALQPDGKIIIGGALKINAGRKGIARLNADGSMDEAFSSYIVATGNSNYGFYQIVLQPDGKILVAGSCPSSNTTFLKLARLNADGSKDNGFSSMTYTSTTTPVQTGGTVFSLALQPDGKIIVGGGFNHTFGTTAKNNFVRLTAAGALDTSFVTGTATGTSLLNAVNDIALQPDGKIIIGGSFSIYNGIARRRIARINATGSLDTTFAVGTGLDNSVNSVGLFADGSVLISGNFDNYDSTTRHRIAKISVNTITVTSLSASSPFCAGATLNVNYLPTATGNTGNVFTAQLSDANGSFTNATAIGTLTATTAGAIPVTIPTNTPSGTGYRIRVISSTPVVTGTDNGTTITINATPVPIAIAQSFCGSATVNELQVTLAENATASWYANTTDAILPSNAALVSGNYYVSQTINGCESPRITVAVTVTAPLVPNFSNLPAFCSESVAPLLATTSPNAITGTWNPATVSNTQSGTYTFTPDAGQCATPISITTTVTENSIPEFAPIAPFCTGSVAPQLNATSTNGITGTWNPATVSNTQSGTYTFTPDAGQCATPISITTTVTENSIPEFAPIAPFCTGSVAPQLNATSTNGITGTWNPATVSNTQSATYTFTPDAGQCATPISITTTVTENSIPEFAPIAPFCTGSVTPLLSATSTNGITGTWNPATVSNTQSGTYTFTPDAGQCATPISITTNVTENSIPEFAPIAPFCSGSVAPQLNATSTNGITGAWNPATVSNTQSATYTFTPDAGQCATPISFTTTVTENSIPEFAPIAPFCTGSVAPLLSATSTNGITGAWNPATISNTQSTTYTFTPDAGQCATIQIITITPILTPAPTGSAIQDYTEGQSLNDFSVTGEALQWYTTPGGTPLSGTQEIVSGVTYYASQTISGCESQEYLAITAGINLGMTSFSKLELRLYPNPATDRITIESNETITSITVYTALGQQLMALKPNLTQTSLIVSQFAAGTYSIIVDTATASKRIRIIKK